MAKGDLDDINDGLREQLDLQKQITKGSKELGEYYRGFVDIQGHLNELKKAEKELTKEIEELEKDKSGLNADEIEFKKNHLKQIEKEIYSEKRKIDVYKSQHKVLNQIKALGNDMLSGSKKLRGGLIDITKEFFKQDEVTRGVARNIGLSGSRLDAFRGNLYKAGSQMALLGGSVSEAAEMYGSFSEDVGRSVVATQSGAMAMTKMAQGTALGSQGSAEMAANMDNVGYSIERSAEYVEDVSNMSEKMGVNSGKVLKSLNSNFKQMSTYKFKDGVKGMASMAAKASKMRMEMSDIAGFAEKVFDPEGAIDTAAQLQVLGGAFASIADPMQLMFRARNDMEGLQDDIIKATGELANFNRESGEFEFSSMELSRMRKISEATGISMEKLSESGREAAKQLKIKGEVGVNVDKKYTDFLATQAVWSEDKQEFVIEIDGTEKTMSEIRGMGNGINDALKKMVDGEKTLEDRAKNAQSFNQKLENILNSLKSLALPLLEGIEGGLDGFVKTIMDTMSGTDFKEIGTNLAEIGKSIGGLLKSFLGGSGGDSFIGTINGLLKGVNSLLVWSQDNPIKAGLIAGAAFFSDKIVEGAMWLKNGYLLAKGFNSAVSLNSGGRKGGGDMLSNLSGSRQTKAGGKMVGNSLKKGGKGLGKGLKILGKGMGKAGLIGTLITGGLEVGMGMADGKSFTDSLMGSLPSIIGGGIGTALGAFGGPPGMMIGGMLGSMAADALFGEAQDFIYRDGQPIQAFSDKDTVVGMKDDGAFSKIFNPNMNNENYEKAVPNQPMMNGLSQINFSPLSVGGTIKLEMVGSNGGYQQVDTKWIEDPIFISKLKNIILNAMESDSNGGKR